MASHYHVRIPDTSQQYLCHRMLQQDEAARLEAELEARHAAELAAFDSKQPDDADADGDGAPGQPDLLNSDLYSVTLNGLAPPKQVCMHCLCLPPSCGCACMFVGEGEGVL